MCTIGALRVKDDEVLLFKNKDFAQARFSDRVVLDADVFGPRGLETFGADASVDDVFSGLSLGANRHGLLACVNNVLITQERNGNYDRLVETALREGRDVDEAILAITDAVAAHPYWWGNVILADLKQLAALEVRGQEIRVERDRDRIFRTNHQPLFGEIGSPEDLPCSATRFASARSRLGDVHSVDDLKAMLASHDDGETGICNHGVPLTTVYSYILQRKAGEMILHVANGLPCMTQWSELALPLGPSWTEARADAFRSEYPGGLAL